MAHVLVVFEEGTRRHVIRAVVEDVLGQTAMVAEDFWGAVAVLRTSLHPLVVLYERPGGLDRLSPEQVEALVANGDALARHRYIVLVLPAPALPPVEAAIEELLFPYDIEDIVAAVRRAAAHLAEQRE